MISQEQTDRVIALNNLRDAILLLNGKMITSTVSDSLKKSFKRIIIEYDHEKT